MSETVKSCGPDTNMAEAAALMFESDCGTLPVVADGGRVIGMITDRDIAIALGTKNRPASEIRVSEAMSRQVYSCGPDEEVHSALKTMRKDKVRRLPVVDGEGALRGIFSLNDVILRAEKVDAHKGAGLSYEDVVNTLKGICEHQPPEPAKEAKLAAR
jgi:CBS domain-containing protein